MITWNPLDKHNEIRLSNGNLTATRTTSVYLTRSVRGTEGKSMGKWYFEFVSGDSKSLMGVSTVDALLSSAVGDDVYGYGYSPIGRTRYNTITSNLGYSSCLYDDIVGVALDLDNGQIWWSVNGVWQGTGDPVYGSSPAYTGVSGTFYPMASVRHSRVVLRPASHMFSYDVPYGFLALNDSYIFNGYTQIKAGDPEYVITVSGVDLYFYRRDTGALIGHSKSLSDGSFEFNTTYSGEHFVVALDSDVAPSFNDVVVGKVTPALLF